VKLKLPIGILLFCGVVALAGCAKKSSQELMSELEKGMTPEDVKYYVGSPSTDKALRDKNRLYVYEVSDGYVTVYFVNGKLAQVRRTDRLVFR
jgi:outer membrane protein assembly factor BamE (lipoprotein component of BamABCDE complex)